MFAGRSLDIRQGKNILEFMAATNDGNKRQLLDDAGESPCFNPVHFFARSFRHATMWVRNSTTPNFLGQNGHFVSNFFLPPPGALCFISLIMAKTQDEVNHNA